MTNRRTFSPLLNSWFSDARVREAVGALTPGKLPTEFSPEFEWDDFPSYVDAWLAAQQVVAEWCKNLFEMWDEVWGKALGPKKEYWPREQIRAELSNGGIHEAWDGDWHARGVCTPRGDVNLVVFCNVDKARLQVELPEELGNLVLQGWENDNEDGTPVLNGPEVPIRIDKGAASVDLDELQQHAEQALGLLWTGPAASILDKASKGVTRSKRMRK